MEFGVSDAAFERVARAAGYGVGGRRGRKPAPTPLDGGALRPKFNALVLAATRAVLDTVALFLVASRGATVTEEVLTAVHKVARRLAAPHQTGGGDYFQAAEYYGRASGRYAAGAPAGEHSSVGDAAMARQPLPASLFPPTPQAHAAAQTQAQTQQQRGGGDYFQAAEYYGRASGRYAAGVPAGEHTTVGDAGVARQAVPVSAAAVTLLGGGGGSATMAACPAWLTDDALGRVLKEYRARRADRAPQLRVAEGARKPLRRLIERSVVSAVAAARHQTRTKTLTARVLTQAAARAVYPL